MASKIPKFQPTSTVYGNTIKGFSYLSENTYTRSNGKVITVYDKHYGLLDDTQGCGAMYTLPLAKGIRNLDLGGGQWDTVSLYLWNMLKIINLVYDPFGRAPEHNTKVLNAVEINKVDSVTSISVMNVIVNEEERFNHLQLAYDSLKCDGIAFFKIWRGCSSQNVRININENPNVIQLNKEAQYYIPEMEQVFGRNNVILIRDDIGNTIFSFKRRKIVVPFF